MLFRRIPAAAILAVALLLLPTLAFSTETWVEVRSPHFSVVTDGGEKRGRDVASRLEQMRTAFGVLVNKDHINIPIPVEVIAFKSTKELRQYSPLFKGKPIEIAGYYLGGQDRNFIALDLSANNALEAIFHEYAHMLLNGNYPPMPVWFDEGFAQYYETITIDRKTITLGKAPESAGYVFRQFNFIPLGQLLAVGHDSAVYNESGDRRNIFYLESWLLVHYIFDKKKLKQMGQYAELVQAENEPPADALQRAFGTTPQALQKELEGYLHSMTVWTYTMSGEIKPEDFTVRTLRPTDAQAILADLHLHESDYQQQAVKEFEAVLAAEPNNSAAHRGLGYAYLEHGDFEKAAGHFQAAAADTTDPRVLYYSAMLARMRGPLQPADIDDMRAKATKAISLDPAFADAYSLLAFADTASGDYDAALNAIVKAATLSPRNERYLAQLGQLLLLNKKWDDATTLFTRLKNSSNPMSAFQAEQALELIAQARSSKDVTVAPQGDGAALHWTTTTPTASAPTPAAMSSSPPPEGPPPALPTDSRAIQFLKGRLVAVDCSHAPAADITVAAGAKTWTFHTNDRAHLVLLGADSFSCDWKDKKVAVNYRASGAAAGDLVSIELQ